MTKKIIFQDAFLVSGIMCHDKCGTRIKSLLNKSLEESKKKGLLPEDTTLIIDAEAQTLGIHRYLLFLESETAFDCDQALVGGPFREAINATDKFKVISETEPNQQNHTNRRNWINIGINMAAIIAIICLSIVFPPSIFLTIGLTAITFLSTAFTAREYIFDFFRNLREKKLANMPTTITLGWFLSLAHSLYHSITMPLMTGFSMVFMSFLMPVMLISFINGMDEIKRQVLQKSKKIHLQGMKMLFPQMAEEYPCYQLSEEKRLALTSFISNRENSSEEFNLSIENILADEKVVMERKSLLRPGMVITIKRGECFPVDCVILEGNTTVDTSILNGEPQQGKKPFDVIPGGSINLGQTVTAYVTQDAYNSTVNRLLLPSNRAREKLPQASNQKFIYIYVGLIALGLTASLIAPLLFGILTIPLLLQNVMGILFATCLCTIAIAHQLSRVLSIYQRSRNGIILRDDSLSLPSDDEIKVIVFDKTNTLTTGNSQLESSEGISDSLWEKIYLLEKHSGGDHPLARAIITHYETMPGASQSMFSNDVKEGQYDSENRGLSAVVQGKRIHIGKAEFLIQSGIEINLSEMNPVQPGLTPIYIAENNVFQGVAYFRQQARAEIFPAMTRLKDKGIRFIMLTGDSESAAKGFNIQNGNFFAEDDIHWDQTPQKKANYISDVLVAEEKINPKHIWFVGDGLNDGPISKRVGVSCSITADDKVAFFTDISLNGTLDYLLHHHTINRLLQRNIRQNQWLLVFSTLSFLAFIITFSFVGIAVSPIIPLCIMLTTTLLVIFNSYRAQLAVDIALEKNLSWPKRFLASNFSTGLLVGAAALFILGILISTVATGGLALPAIAFTGIAAAATSVCILGAVALLTTFLLIGVSYLCVKVKDQGLEKPVPKPDLQSKPSIISHKEEKNPDVHYPGIYAKRSKDEKKDNMITIEESAIIQI